MSSQHFEKVSDNSLEIKIKEWLAGDDTKLNPILPFLKKIDNLTYETLRDDIAKKAKIRVSVLDDEVGVTKKVNKISTDSNISFDEIDPWEEAVEGCDIYTNIKEILRSHVVMDEKYITACALWILFAHGLNIFDINPRLFITSPEKGCGKSTLLSMIEGFVPRPLPASNSTPAAIFRAIDKWSPTLLIDEADSFIKQNDELRGILNSGHTRPQAFILRVTGENHEPRRFSTWAPIAMAGIGEIWDTLEDRSIVVELQRKSSNEKIERLKQKEFKNKTISIRQKIKRWVLDHSEALTDHEPNIPPQLGNRTADNWHPLIAIAELTGVGDEARNAAIGLSTGAEDGSIRIKLLQDLKILFERKQPWDTANLIEALSENESSPWGDWSSGKKISPQKLAALLKPFGIRSKQLWVNQSNKHGYEFSQFREVFARYLTIQDAKEARTIDSKDVFGNSSTLEPDAYSVSKNEINIKKTTALASLASHKEEPPSFSSPESNVWFENEERSAIKEFGGG